MRRPEPDGIHLARVIEGTEPDPTGGERGVGGFHDGRGKVIVIDPDDGRVETAFDADAVPDFLTPFHAVRGAGGDLPARGAIDEEDVVGVVVGDGCDVGVVEVGGVADAEEQAHVAMPIFAAGLEEIGFEDEIAELDPGEEGDVDGGTDGRCVAALTGEFEGQGGTVGGVSPRGGISGFEALEGAGGIEVFFGHQFPVGRNAGCGRVAGFGEGDASEGEGGEEQQG